MKQFKLIVGLLLLGLMASGSALGATGIATDPMRSVFTARQLGMGGVAVGFAHDASGIFTNPSGLVGLNFPQLVATSRKLTLDETQYILSGWAWPTDYGAFGLGYVGQSTAGSIPTKLDPATGRIIQDPSQEASSYLNSVLTVSYAKNVRAPFNLNLDLGGNLKFYNQTLAGSAADRGTGMAIDVSASYKPLSWVKVGALAQNFLGATIKWAGSEDRLGGFYKIGGAFNIWGATGEAYIPHSQSLQAGVDVDLPSGVLASSGAPNLHLGAEYSPYKDTFLRTGWDSNGLSLGIGMVNGGFRFDYAYATRGDLPGDNPHYFTLSYVGERVLTISKKLKNKLAYLKFVSPKNRFITDKDVITLSAEAWALRRTDKTRTWTVTAISDTKEVSEIFEYEPLAQVTLNSRPFVSGTFEAVESLGGGRNIFRLYGQVSGETLTASAELKVLRIVPFDDVPMSFWAADPIYLNAVLGIVNGYPDNTFKPEKGITRAELVTLLVKSLGTPQATLDGIGTDEVFSDVKYTHWAHKHITHGNSLRYVTGYPDGTFKPNKVLTRAEGITILARYAGLTEEANVAGAPFPDLTPGFWANKYIVPAKQAGLLNYLSGKEFEFKKEFTRAEACEILIQVRHIKDKIDAYWDTGLISAGQ